MYDAYIVRTLRACLETYCCAAFALNSYDPTQSSPCVQDYIQQHGPPATNLITSAYYENYFRWYNFQRLADGTYRLSTNVGTEPFAQNTVEDIGASAAGVPDCSIVDWLFLTPSIAAMRHWQCLPTICTCAI